MDFLGRFKYLLTGGGNSWQHFFHGTRKSYHFRRITEYEAIQAFLGNDAVYSIINYLASNLSNLPVDYFRGDTLIESPSDPYKVLMDRPCPPKTRDDFFYRCAVYLYTTGDIFILKDQGTIGFSDSKKLIVLPSHCVYPHRNKSDIFGEVEYYEVQGFQGKQRRYEPEEIIHLQYFDPDPYHSECDKGLSPFQPGNWILQANNNLTVGESQILENRGASHLISAKNTEVPIRQKDKELLDEAFVQLAGGADKMNKSLRLDTPVDVTTLGMSPSDLKLIEMYPTHLKRICTLLNVPAELFNAQGSGQFNTRKEARKAAFSEAIIPSANMIFAAIDQGIQDWGFEGYRQEVDKDKIDALNPDRSERMTEVRELYNAGLISREAALRMLDIEDDGSQFVKDFTNGKPQAE